MVPTSSIPAFRAALLALLGARSGLSGVHLSDGPPPAAVLQESSYIALLKVKGRQTVRALATTRPKEERYTQIVELSVVGQTRSDQVTIGDKVFANLAEIEDAIRVNSNLAGYYSGPGSIYSVILGDEEYDAFADDQQRESRITVGLDVHARL